MPTIPGMLVSAIPGMVVPTMGRMGMAVPTILMGGFGWPVSVYVYVEIVPGADAVEVAPETVMVSPGTAGLGDAVILATGAGWIATVMVAGALGVPRLSVTTSSKVTDPVTLGGTT